jgi:tRNA threonylcarbamoyladenosine biosynthesis protein TsaE
VEIFAGTEEQTKRVAADVARQATAGDVFLLSGPLGAGKTTFVRGFLAELGHIGPVRSPTFNLVQTFETDPPVMHADLYRVTSHQGIGLEEYLETHVCMIEWPDRAEGLVNARTCWLIRIDFHSDGRQISVTPPAGADQPK